MTTQPTGEVPEGTAAQPGAPEGASETEAKLMAIAKAAADEAVKGLKNDLVAARAAQAASDKRSSQLERRLQEEVSTRQMLEQQIAQPLYLGPDADVDVQRQVQLQQAQRELALRRQIAERQQAEEAQRQAQERFNQLFTESVADVAGQHGIKVTDDPRIDLAHDAPDGYVKLKRVVHSLLAAREQDLEQTIDSKVAEAIAARDAKARRESGVDEHVTTPSLGGSGAQTFTRDQIRDPAFWKANREAILKAQSEGRIK